MQAEDDETAARLRHQSFSRICLLLAAIALVLMHSSHTGVTPARPRLSTSAGNPSPNAASLLQAAANVTYQEAIYVALDERVSSSRAKVTPAIDVGVAPGHATADSDGETVGLQTNHEVLLGSYAFRHSKWGCNQQENKGNTQDRRRGCLAQLFVTSNRTNCVHHWSCISGSSERTACIRLELSGNNEVAKSPTNGVHFCVDLPVPSSLPLAVTKSGTVYVAMPLQDTVGLADDLTPGSSTPTPTGASVGQYNSAVVRSRAAARSVGPPNAASPPPWCLSRIVDDRVGICQLLPLAIIDESGGSTAESTHVRQPIVLFPPPHNEDGLITFHFDGNRALHLTSLDTTSSGALTVTYSLVFWNLFSAWILVPESTPALAVLGDKHPYVGALYLVELQSGSQLRVNLDNHGLPPR